MRPVNDPSLGDVAGLVFDMDIHRATLNKKSDLSDPVPPTNGDPVGYVSPGVGTTATILQATDAKRPTLSTSGINSKYAIDLGTGSSHLHLRIDGYAAVLNGNDKPHTIFCVIKLDAAVLSAGMELWSGVKADGLQIESAYYETSEKVNPLKYNGTGTQPGVGAVALTTSAACVTIRNNGTTIDTWVNGTVDIAAGSFDRNSMTIERFAVGARPVNTPSNGFRGLIARAAGFNSALTAAQINYIHSLIAADYALTIPVL